MKAITIYEVYVLLYFTGTNEVVFFDSFIYGSANQYEFKYQRIYKCTSPLSIYKGVITSSFYFGGNDDSNAFASGSSFPTSFVWSFTATQNKITQ
jgi:hypothetical protein